MEIPLSQTADKPVSTRLVKSGNATITNCRQTRVSTSDLVLKCHIHKLQTNPCLYVWLSLEMPQSQNADKPVSPRLAKSVKATFTNCRQTNPRNCVWLSLEMPHSQTADRQTRVTAFGYVWKCHIHKLQTDKPASPRLA